MVLKERQDARSRQRAWAEQRHLRIIGPLVIVAELIAWYSNTHSDLNLIDPWWGRAIAIAAVTVTVGATYLRGIDRRWLQFLVLATLYTMTARHYMLITINNVHYVYVIGAFMILTGFIAMSTYITTTNRQLLAYLTFWVVGLLVSAATANDPQLVPGYSPIPVVLVAFLAYVAVRAQILTLKDLRASEEQALGMVGAVPDLLVQMGKRTTTREVLNAAACPFGKLAAAGIGAPLRDLLNDGDGSRLEDCVAEALSEGSSAFDTSVRVGDDLRHLEFRIAPTGHDAVLALIRDVTEQRAMEARLRVSDRLASLGTLASGVAHEINNPLTYVKGNIEYATRELEKSPAEGRNEDVLEALREGFEGSERIARIVADLHEHSKPDGEEIGPVDANAAIQSALRMLGNQLRHKTRLETDLGDLPPVRASKSRLVQVLLNIVANAIHAVQDPDPERNLVRVQSRVAGDDVSIAIRDNGVGMSHLILERIFDPFFTTREPGEGSGVGLYLCHQFVESFGGSIHVDSRQREGSTFTVSLHRATQIEKKQPPPEPLRVSSVLVIDDEPLVARSLARALPDVNVTVAGSAREGLEACRREHFGLILCDLMMPGEWGADFYAALRKDYPEQIETLAFMTGGAFTPEARAFVDQVSVPCLSKPIDRKALVEAMHFHTNDA